ncbi:MAG: hypothetical protein E6Q55_30075 [Mycolicibacterium mageritense]|nr:MAG: hypothetical protein E6Q55_30075 [Mycolicibacterium mageritense]
MSSASRATVPSAYLHPRFQGQEPPGFPGRFTGVLVAMSGTWLSTTSSRRASSRRFRSLWMRASRWCIGAGRWR